jgi:hypothetical protein
VPYRAPASAAGPENIASRSSDTETTDAGRAAPCPDPLHVATVRDARAESPTARTLVLDVPEWPGHRAGHDVDVRLTVQVRTSRHADVGMTRFMPTAGLCRHRLESPRIVRHPGAAWSS